MKSTADPRSGVVRVRAAHLLPVRGAGEQRDQSPKRKRGTARPVFLCGRASERERGRGGEVRLICLAGILATAALSGGCGYSSSGLYRGGIRTVYVDMFQSKEFRRGIEFQVTEALRKYIDRETPYRNAPKNRADTVLSGEVLAWTENTIGRDYISGLPEQKMATLTIRYRWQDMRTGKILVDKPRLQTTIEYVPSLDENVYNGRDDAANKIARLIVSSMETPW